ncbi:NAD-dependent epimerase/dehydratase family protein [Escherichia coli]
MVWGSGTPMREFLHVDDMAAASVAGVHGAGA